MITVQCIRETTTHARLRAIKEAVRIEYGVLRGGRFRTQEMEVLSYREFPELRAIYDGSGWNVRELRALLSAADGTALPEAVTVLLTQKDINLLSARGLEVAL